MTGCRTIIQKHVNECLQRAEERIEWLLKLEDRPFSLNTHYLADYKDKFYSYYKGARERDEKSDLVKLINNYCSSSNTVESAPSFGKQAPTGLAKVLTGLAEMGLAGIKPEDIPKLLPPDRMEPAIHIMSDVRAYFQGGSVYLLFSLWLRLNIQRRLVAYKRFADNVPLAVDFELVRGVERDLLKTLYTTLGINGPDGHRICKELAQESSHIADRRADLKKKLERLEFASSELMRIGV